MARKKLAALIALRELEEQSERTLQEHLEFRHASGLLLQHTNEATKSTPPALDALCSPQVNPPAPSYIAPPHAIRSSSPVQFEEKDMFEEGEY
jgi:hypothetical protein